MLNLPALGTMFSLTPQFNPATINGLTIHTEDALKIDFILNQGDTKLTSEELINESSKMIKYFLAALTVPDTQRWVHFSPYEKERIIAQDFGKTEMGKDLLEQEYLLK